MGECLEKRKEVFFKDKCHKIYQLFAHEFNDADGSFWKFIMDKNLGIIYSDCGSYRVVDEKQWALTRIKYGI